MNPREPALAFAHASAASRLPGVMWITPRFDGVGYQIEESDDGTPIFSGPPLVLPTPMRDAAEDAIALGMAPLAEVLALLIARPAWLIQSRRTLWTPISAAPALLDRLVETYGVGVEIHRRDGARLARLTARLPTWYPRRGQLGAALELLEHAVAEPVVHPTASRGRDGEAPLSPPLRAERFACHSARWWAEHEAGASTAVYRVEGNYLRFQPEKGATLPLQREDVLLGHLPDAAPPTALLRLLPVWTTLRLTS